MAVEKTIQLNNGVTVPRLGLGCFLGKTVSVDDVPFSEIIEQAVSAGYRHFDTAQLYGTHAALGDGLKKCLEKKLVSREELFVATKVWNTCHSRGRVFEAVVQSLKELQLDYLDLCLIHWPQGYKEGGADIPFDDENKYVIPSDIDFMETYKALEECVASGKVKCIGVSNFNIQQLKRLLQNCTVRPAVLQIELNPYIIQEQLRSFCESEHIAVTAYSPFGNPARPAADHPPGCPPTLFSSDVISRVAKKHKKTLGQVLLRWNLQHGNIVIPKTVHKNRMEENLLVFDFELTEEEMKEIDAMNVDYRSIVFEWDIKNPLYPF